MLCLLTHCHLQPVPAANPGGQLTAHCNLLLLVAALVLLQCGVLLLLLLLLLL
jgi:hypothetical protein